jgi:hypothetical protein
LHTQNNNYSLKTIDIQKESIMTNKGFIAEDNFLQRNEIWLKANWPNVIKTSEPVMLLTIEGMKAKFV